MSQLEMFAPPAARQMALPTAETVRPRLEAVLAQVRSGRAAEWSKAEHRRWRVVFPQVCEWLPPEEREKKRAEFAQLLEAA